MHASVGPSHHVQEPRHRLLAEADPLIRRREIEKREIATSAAEGQQHVRVQRALSAWLHSTNSGVNISSAPLGIAQQAYESV